MEAMEATDAGGTGGTGGTEATDATKDAGGTGERSLPYADMCDKLEGLFYGCLIGDVVGGAGWGYSTDQLVMMLNTLTKHRTFDVTDFVQQLRLYTTTGLVGVEHDYMGDYTRRVVTAGNALVSPAENAFDQRALIEEGKRGDTRLRTNNNEALIRAAFVGMYQEWDIFSFASCMATHMDHRCVSAAVVVTAVVNGMLAGNKIAVTEAVADAASMVLALDKMTNQADVDEYLRFTSEGYCTDPDLLALGAGHTGNVYKTMAQSMYALGVVGASKDGPSDEVFLETLRGIAARGGDAQANCALSGALMGCEVGFKRLPLREVSGIVPPAHMGVLKEAVDHFIQTLGFAKDGEEWRLVRIDELSPEDAAAFGPPSKD